MAMEKSLKSEVVKKFRRSELDTGSSEVQIALLTERIKGLADHFKNFKNDVHSQRGLVRMVNRRRKLLDYLRSTTPDRYVKIIADLGIRK